MKKKRLMEFILQNSFDILNLQKQINQIMTKQQEVDNLVSSFNDATNGIASELDKLHADILNDTVSEEGLQKLAEISSKLKGLGSSTANPIPGTSVVTPTIPETPAVPVTAPKIGDSPLTVPGQVTPGTSPGTVNVSPSTPTAPVVDTTGPTVPIGSPIPAVDPTGTKTNGPIATTGVLQTP
jgi:hypothetical protein